MKVFKLLGDKKKRKKNCTDNSSFYIKYNLQFFAEGEGGEKTEEATAKKLEKAREEGQVAKSNELVIGVSLLMLFLALKLFVGYVGRSFTEVFVESYNYIGNFVNKGFNKRIALSALGKVLTKTLVISLPFYLSAVVSSVAVNVGQVKWKVTSKPLMPKLDRLSPIQGFKRMFSKDKLFELVKAIVKVGLIF